MPASRVSVTLLLGKKLLPCRVIVLPEATFELPLSERFGAKAVRPRPTKIEARMRSVARTIKPLIRQLDEPPVVPVPVDPPGPFPVGPGGVYGGVYGGFCGGIGSG